MDHPFVVLSNTLAHCRWAKRQAPAAFFQHWNRTILVVALKAAAR